MFSFNIIIVNVCLKNTMLFLKTYYKIYIVKNKMYVRGQQKTKLF